MTLILIDPLTGKAVEHDIESWGAQCRLDPIDEAAALPEGTVIYTTEEATPSLLSDAELLATLRSVEWVQWDGGVYCPGCFANWRISYRNICSYICCCRVICC